MCADHGGIDDRRCVIDVDLEFAEQIRPRILLSPTSEPVVNGLPWAESFWQVSPRHAGPRSIDDRVDEQPITTRGLSTLCTPRQQRLNSCPLFVGQRMPMHGQL